MTKDCVDWEFEQDQWIEEVPLHILLVQLDIPIHKNTITSYDYIDF